MRLNAGQCKGGPLAAVDSQRSTKALEETGFFCFSQIGIFPFDGDSSMPRVTSFLMAWLRHQSTNLPERLRDKDVLTPEEFQKLLQQLSVRDRAMVLLIGSTGLRRSEMIALTWSDLNLRTMEVNVLRSCVRNRIGKTKTDSSCRPVPLHHVVLSALLEWRKRSPYANDLDFLFPSIWQRAKRPLSPNSHSGEEHPAGAGEGRHRWQANRLAQLSSLTGNESEIARHRHQGRPGTDASFELSHDA